MLPPRTTLLENSYEALVATRRAGPGACSTSWGSHEEPKCLDFHQTERVVITASKWQVRQKITAASAGRWRQL